MLNSALQNVKMQFVMIFVFFTSVVSFTIKRVVTQSTLFKSLARYCKCFEVEFLSEVDYKIEFHIKFPWQHFVTLLKLVL